MRSTNGAVQVLGDISPGTSSAGTLFFEPDLDLGAGASCTWGTNDVIQVRSNLTASGAWTLNLVNPGSLPRGENVFVVAHAQTINPNVLARGSVASLVWRLATQDAVGGGKDLIIVNQPVGTVVQIK